MILVAPEDRWNALLDAAKAKFAAEHPDVELSLDVQICHVRRPPHAAACRGDRRHALDIVSSTSRRSVISRQQASRAT